MTKLSLRDPVSASVLAIVVTFVVALVILYVAKPKMVRKANDSDANKQIDWAKLVAYAALIAILVGLLVLLVLSFAVKKTPTIASYRYGRSMFF